ncbi:hypothetical protein RCI35_001295 [Enterobacter hormaechei]|nr:hypothetical protein [Enterobacter hormaechei]
MFIMGSLKIEIDDELKASVNAKIKLINITPTEVVTLLYQYIDDHDCFPFVTKNNFSNKGDILKTIHNDIKSVILILSGIVSQMVVKGRVDKSLMCSSIAGLKISREFLKEGKNTLSTEIHNERCSSLILDIIAAIDSAIIQCEITSAARQDDFILMEYSSVTKINAELAALERYEHSWSCMSSFYF